MRFIKSVVAAAMWLGVWYAVQYGLMYAGVGLVKTAAAFGLITISEAFAMHFNAIAPMAAEVAIVPVAWALFAMRKKPPLRSLGFAPCRVSSVIAGAILGFLACLTVTLLLVYTPFPESWQTDYTESSKEVLDRGSPVYTIIASVIVSPIVEEIVFRG
ncbi:MAG: hypothetical protein IKV35_04375, partial [Clostridia bacterium]|nr:hypothetical protein [Clostridia bacterium]